MVKKFNNKKPIPHKNGIGLFIKNVSVSFAPADHVLCGFSAAYAHIADIFLLKGDAT